MNEFVLLHSPDVVDVLDHVQDGDVPLPAVVAEVAGEEVDHDQAADLRHPLEHVNIKGAAVNFKEADITWSTSSGVREDHRGQRGVHHLDNDNNDDSDDDTNDDTNDDTELKC